MFILGKLPAKYATAQLPIVEPLAVIGPMKDFAFITASIAEYIQTIVEWVHL